MFKLQLVALTPLDLGVENKPGISSDPLGHSLGTLLSSSTLRSCILPGGSESPQEISLHPEERIGSQAWSCA
ncbi:unnamed protein product [Coccothraustes coccothraustes]